MNPRIVKDIFTSGLPASKLSLLMQVNAPLYVQKGIEDDHAGRYLAATMYLCAPDLITSVDPPADGSGDDIAEQTAATSLWGWGMGVPYDVIRRACYAAADKENQKKALQFWRIAIRQGHKNLPVGGKYDFIGWSNTLFQSHELVYGFLKGYTWDVNKVQGNQPIESVIQWKSLTEFIFKTAWGMPPNMKKIPMWAEVYKNRQIDYQTKVTLSDGGTVEVEIVTTNDNAGEETGMYLAGTLASFLIDGEHRKFTLKVDEKASYIADYLIAALILHDGGRPVSDGKHHKRKETGTSRNGVFIGLAEARVSENYREVWPVVQSPVLQKARVELSEDDAKVLRRYIFYGDIAKEESPPPGLRFAGVEREAKR